MKAVYLAAPFFNEEQVNKVKQVEGVLNEIRVPFFSPRTSLGQENDMTLGGRQAIFHNDIKMLDRCEYVVAILDDKDTGTLFETGYAYANNKPIIYVSFEDIDKINLMLSQSAYAIIPNGDMGELHDTIEEMVYDVIEPSNESWKMMNERDEDEEELIGEKLVKQEPTNKVFRPRVAVSLATTREQLEIIEFISKIIVEMQELGKLSFEDQQECDETVQRLSKDEETIAISRLVMMQESLKDIIGVK